VTSNVKYATEEILDLEFATKITSLSNNVAYSAMLHNFDAKNLPVF